MRIGKWTIRTEGWSLVFDREIARWHDPALDILRYSGPSWTEGTQVLLSEDLSGFIDLHKHSSAPTPVSWADLSMHYSAEDIARWKEEIIRNLSGAGVGNVAGPGECRHHVAGGCALCRGSVSSGVV